MYPLLLKAPLKDYLWGGRRLIDEYGFETEKEKADAIAKAILSEGDFSGWKYYILSADNSGATAL